MPVPHPNANVDGKNLYDAPDSDGVFFARKQIEAGINGGGFVYYRFPRATGGDLRRRRSCRRPNN